MNKDVEVLLAHLAVEGQTDLWELARVICRPYCSTRSLLASMEKSGLVNCLERGKAGHYPKPSVWEIRCTEEVKP